METILGAGVVAGTVYYGLALREAHKEKQKFLRRDQQFMEALESGGAFGSFPAELRERRQWLLLVHVQQVDILDQRLEGAAVSVLCKYGQPARSLRRETHWLRVIHGEDGKLLAEHHETFVFAWSTEVAPIVRLRLRKLGRLTRTIGKAHASPMNFARQADAQNLVRHEEVPLVGSGERHVGNVKVIYEARSVALGELYQYGFQVGHVVSHIGLEGADMPLVQGVSLDEAPPLGEHHPSRSGEPSGHVLVGHVVPEQPGAEDGAESELESVAEDASSDDRGSESESTTESSSGSEPEDGAYLAPRRDEGTTRAGSGRIERHQQRHPACGCCQ